MITSTHNIRRPALWLVLMCVGAIGFFLLTDPQAGLVHFGTSNEVDAARNARAGTVLGLGGAGIILAVALFLCTRKGSPPTGPALAKGAGTSAP